jgi:ATP-dependent Clp protease ATP-binding subunit ClpA
MMLRIVEKFLDELHARLAERKVRLLVTGKAKELLARKGFDPGMGARPLRRLLRSEVEDRLANELLFGGLKKGGKASLTWKNGEFSLSVS